MMFAMQLMARGCGSPLVPKLASALKRLGDTGFMESEEMTSVVGEEGASIDSLGEAELGMMACVADNIDSLDDLAGVLDMSPQDAAMMKMMYPVYVEMAAELVGLLRGQKALIDDPEALEAIDLIDEIYEIAREIGLLSVE